MTNEVLNPVPWLKVGPPADRTDATGPAFLRSVFPYSLPPLAWFDADAVPLAPSESIWITDTTFRDGQQSRAPYSPEQIADLYDLLHRLGGPQGMIRQSEFFLYSDKDRRAVDLCQEKGHRFPEITGWIRATLDDYRLVQAAGLRETGILTSISDYHIMKKLASDRRTVLDGYLAVVDAALSDGVIPRCHLEDATRADVPAVVIPFVEALMERSQQAGIPVKVRYPDTLGVGIPHPNASLPRGIPRLTWTLHHEAGVPSEWLEFHGQNDLAAIVPNGVCAWLHGASANNGTLLGIGERSGNTPIEALAFWLVSLTGDTHGMDLPVISEIADYYRAIGEPVDSRLPFVGDNFNVTRAGIHADGMIKDEEIYNPFDTTTLLHRPPGVGITDKSGAAGLLLWLQRHRPDLAAGVSKRDPRLAEVLAAVTGEYDSGRITGLADVEVAELVDRAFAVPAGPAAASRRVS
jgi:isopropylmalate/homocitrate/citramalate synthase